MLLYSKMLRAGAKIRQAAFAHSFNHDLMTGKLPMDVFCNFLDQDYLYLKEYSMLLKNLGEGMKNNHERNFFATLSDDACAASYKLHRKYLQQINPQKFFSHTKTSEKNPVLRSYTDWQTQLVKEKSPRAAMAGLMACFSLYSYLGEEMNLRPTPNNPFQPWIDCYSSEKFLQSTRALILRINTWGIELDEVEEKEWIDTFLTAADFEVAFWESVYPTVEISEVRAYP